MDGLLTSLLRRPIILIVPSHHGRERNIGDQGFLPRNTSFGYFYNAVFE